MATATSWALAPPLLLAALLSLAALLPAAFLLLLLLAAPLLAGLSPASLLFARPLLGAGLSPAPCRLLWEAAALRSFWLPVVEWE